MTRNKELITYDIEWLTARLRGNIFDAVPGDNDMQHVLQIAATTLEAANDRARLHAERGNRLSDLLDEAYSRITELEQELEK